MRTREEALSYGLSFPDTYQDAPFRNNNLQLVRYRGNKKAFLWTYEREGFVNLNVKVDPDKAFFWRYPDIARTRNTGTRSFWMGTFRIVILSA